MATLEVEGKNYRIFSEKLLGIYTYYILEDSSNSTKSQGVEFNVKLTNYYFMTLAQVKVLAFDKFVDLKLKNWSQ